MIGVTKLRVIRDTVFGIYFCCVFLVCAFSCLASVLVLPRLRWRQAAARGWAAAVFRLTGTWPAIDGSPPAQGVPCVVVANHASYLDGILLFALLPVGFSFVIKAEMDRVPFAGRVLRQIDSFFVDRDQVQRSAVTARAIIRAARSGRALGFFPEGTFVAEPGLLPFRRGAFAAAQAAGLPIVPVVIDGTRHVLPADRWLPRPGPLKVTYLPRLDADQGDAASLARTAHAAIAERLDEPRIVAPETSA